MPAFLSHSLLVLLQPHFLVLFTSSWSCLHLHHPTVQESVLLCLPVQISYHSFLEPFSMLSGVSHFTTNFLLFLPAEHACAPHPAALLHPACALGLPRSVSWGYLAILSRHTWDYEIISAQSLKHGKLGRVWVLLIPLKIVKYHQF